MSGPSRAAGDQADAIGFVLIVAVAAGAMLVAVAVWAAGGAP